MIRHPLPLIFLLAAWVSALAGCDDGAPETSEAGCVSDEAFFQSLSLSLLEPDCSNCHNPQGAARDTDFVLAAPGETNALQRNFAMMKEVAALERDGVSVLLLKPTGDLGHGGGPRLEVGSAGYRDLEQLVVRFREPVACDEDEGEVPLLEQAILLSPAETLRKAKLQLVGALPTPEEIALVEAEGESALAPLLEEYMTRDAFFDVLKRWYNDLLLTDKYRGGNRATDLLDEETYPGRYYYNNLPEDTEEGRLARRHGNNSVAREPLELVAHVVRNDRPFSEILTADYILVNPFSAPIYGVDVGFDDPLDPTEWREARLPGFPHAGLLTSPMFLNRYPTTATNRNRHRARTVFSLFLATDILAKAERPVDPTQIRDHNPTMNNSQCTVCHAAIDPIAGAFQNFDALGRYRLTGERRDPPEGWHADMRPPGFGEAAIPPDGWSAGLAWLAEQVVADERFALSAVYAVYTGLVGRPPLINPTDRSDPRFENRLAFYNLEQAFLRRVTDVFVHEGYALKSIVPEIVASPFYRAVSSTGLDEDTAVTLEPLGTARLLTPEELDARLRATLGQPWKRRGPDNNLLLHGNEYLFFYGGIDSDDVTRRITEPNGVMANVALRMASEMGCMVTPRDFHRPTGDRILFPYVEPTYAPEDENGFPVPRVEEEIRRNIRYLHQRLLGETLRPGDAEEEATWQLFLDVWREGSTAVKNGDASRDLEGHCRPNFVFETGEGLPNQQHLNTDRNYVIRSWAAVVTYLLADWRFLYHR